MEDIRPNHGYWKSSAATGKLSSILHLSQDHWKLYFTHSAQKSGLFITSLSLRASPSPRVQRPRLQRLRVQRTSPSPTFSRPRVPASRVLRFRVPRLRVPRPRAPRSRVPRPQSHVLSPTSQSPRTCPTFSHSPSKPVMQWTSSAHYFSFFFRYLNQLN